MFICTRPFLWVNNISIYKLCDNNICSHLDFDLDNTLYMFISGRYEYRNKGVDMYLEGLARLNARLKQYNSPVNVVAFIIMPAQIQNYNIESLKGQAVTKQLRDVVGEVSKAIEERIFESALR